MNKALFRKGTKDATSLAALQAAATLVAHVYRNDNPVAAVRMVALAVMILDEIEARELAKDLPPVIAEDEAA